MQTTLAALAVVAVGYIMAYLVFDGLRDRYGYVGGAEYVLIGFMLGAHDDGDAVDRSANLLSRNQDLIVNLAGDFGRGFCRLPGEDLDFRGVDRKTLTGPSPARAATIVAFRARRLVCSAIQRIRSITSQIRSATCDNLAIFRYRSA